MLPVLVKLPPPASLTVRLAARVMLPLRFCYPRPLLSFPTRRSSDLPWLSSVTFNSRLLPLPTLERMTAPATLVNVPLTSMRASLPPPLIDVRSMSPLLTKPCATLTKALLKKASACMVKVEPAVVVKVPVSALPPPRMIMAPWLTRLARSEERRVGKEWRGALVTVHGTQIVEAFIVSDVVPSLKSGEKRAVVL